MREIGDPCPQATRSGGAPGRAPMEGSHRRGRGMTQRATVRWGILGAGGIARRFARSLAHEAGSHLVAASCRSQEKARAFAEEAGLAPDRVFWDEHGAGSAHDALIASPDIDAIYLALPHGMHRFWAERALRAGKAVLCEKPATLSAEEMRRVAAVSLATGSLFMEAMKTRFEPAYREMRRIIGTGELGAVVRVEASLQNDVPREAWERSSYYLDPVQGGALLDTGIYCASWIDDLLPGDVSVVSAEEARCGEVDVYDSAELRVGCGTARLSCAFDRAGSRRAVVACEQGRIVVDDLHRPTHMVVEPEGAAPYDVEAPYEVDDFYPEIEHFARLVRTGAEESPIMPLSASIRCAEILDAIRAAARVAAA